MTFSLSFFYIPIAALAQERDYYHHTIGPCITQIGVCQIINLTKVEKRLDDVDAINAVIEQIK